MEGANGPGGNRVKDGLGGAAAMARSPSRAAEDGDPRISVPTDRAESRDLSEPRELSLEEVLKSYEQPINEEQAWAVCFQCCSGLRRPRPPAAGVGPADGPGSILLQRDGTVSLRARHRHGRAAWLPGTSLLTHRRSEYFGCVSVCKSKFLCGQFGCFWAVLLRGPLVPEPLGLFPLTYTKKIKRQTSKQKI